jgi:hypothetical protein
MVTAEIETAHHLNKLQGHPKILPVRLNFSSPLVYPMSAYLNPLQWAVWRKESDTPKLIEELTRAISGGELPIDEGEHAEILTLPTEGIPAAHATPFRVDAPEGTMAYESPYYIERMGDKIAMQALDRYGVTMTIKGPRQMGKSSLLNRIMIECKRREIRFAFLDFQLVEQSTLVNPDIFYRHFCSLLSFEFGIDDRSDSYWGRPLGNTQNTTNYVRDHLMKEMKDVPVLIAMDEVELMFSTPFRSDFFGMLRSWHNYRNSNDNWKNFNMVLVTSTEPYLFIDNLNQSPFNVGETIELSDFSYEQVFDLNRRHEEILALDQLNHLHKLLGGHPYLSRKAFYLISSGRMDFDQLIEKSIEDDGPFGDHLRNLIFRMSGKEKLQAGFLQVIKEQRCSNEQVYFQLRSGGFIKRTGNQVIPRNELYARYFEGRING